MKDREQLYFLAILLPEAISEKITTIKKDFSEQYGPKHALKLLPHITLQKPFQEREKVEALFEQKLNLFASAQFAFDIKITGFGSFRHSRKKVIYLQLAHNLLLQQLHRKLMDFLRDDLQLEKSDSMLQYHPHITIANRDLTKKQFEKAWPDYENRSFTESFRVNNFHLLKHDGKIWKPIQQYEFK